MSETIRIAKYMRCSTDRQELKVQNEEIIRYIEYTFNSKQFEITEYKDEGYSGKDLSRDNMNRLTQDIKDKKIDVVVAQKLDRLSRKLQDLLLLFDFFKDNKISVHIVNNKIDTSTAQGRMFLQMLGMFAEFERETINERLSAGRKYAKEHGTKSGKPLNRPKIQINIQECIGLYKKGISMNKLAKIYKVSAMTIKSRLSEQGVK